MTTFKTFLRTLPIYSLGETGASWSKNCILVNVEDIINLLVLLLHCVTSITPILKIGDQVLTFDVFWPKHLQEVRSTVYIHVQSI